MKKKPRPSSSTSSNHPTNKPLRAHRPQSAPSSSLRELMAKKREEKSTLQATLEEITDPYSNAQSSKSLLKKNTGVSYDMDTLKHKCEWDHLYPENPNRLSSVITRCQELGLIERCKKIPIEMDDYQDKIFYLHTLEHYKKLEDISNCKSLDEVEREAQKYDAIYFNEFTFDSACKSLKCVLSLVKEVAVGNIQNGMALVRPPGHHAMKNEYCGYCYFNNVAIAAEMCIKQNLTKKILIVDYDVHHGQATQQMFYDRNDVLYFSIHRYEHGTFWPNLMESNFDYIGSNSGAGYNINVPLNEIGLTDEDYLAIVFNILLPVAYEFNPDLIIISAGYDAAIGCPEGQMNVTPGFYAHLVTLLSGLAKGNVAVCLEGGYFLPSLAEGAALTLKALLGDPCPILDPFTGVKQSVIETICNVKRALFKYWTCFNFGDSQKICEFTANYLGVKLEPPYETRNCYPIRNEKEQIYYQKIIEALTEKYKTKLLNVCLVYDDRMLLHKPKFGRDRPERPERLASIDEMFKNFDIYNRCKVIEISERNFDLYNIHDAEYANNLKKMEINETNDVYFNDNTNSVILLAISGLLNVIDQVMNHKSNSGVAIIRPPGHHAEHNNAMGFCLQNNISIGANYLLKKYNVERVLIIDFDVHHGNGTQDFFYKTNKVMYISVHKYDNGKFFPHKTSANYNFHGEGSGEGFNANIPFNNDKMSDTEYLMVFLNVVLPLAYSYQPQVVLVSAGFDAGINDTLGGYKVSPEMFGHFIQLLKPLAEGKLILALEGGYNLTTLSYGITMCTKVLLNDPIPMPNNILVNISPNAVITIKNVTNHFGKFWPIFNLNTELFNIN